MKRVLAIIIIGSCALASFISTGISSDVKSIFENSKKIYRETEKSYKVFFNKAQDIPDTLKKIDRFNKMLDNEISENNEKLNIKDNK